MVDILVKILQMKLKKSSTKKSTKKINQKVEIAKRNELHKFVVLTKRWIVERSFSWLEKCRRL